MKKIIFGRTGYGKSYSLIRPIFRKSNHITIITPNNIDDEMKYMGITSELKKINLNNLSQVPTGKYGIEVHCTGDKTEILNIFKQIEASGLSKKKDFTLVLPGFMLILGGTNILEAIHRFNKWECEMIIEHTCENIEDGMNELNLNNSCWNEWDLSPVFQRLF
jgi:hypothetical protein